MVCILTLCLILSKIWTFDFLTFIATIATCFAAVGAFLSGKAIKRTSQGNLFANLLYKYLEDQPLQEA